MHKTSLLLFFGTTLLCLFSLSFAFNVRNSIKNLYDSVYDLTQGYCGVNSVTTILSSSFLYLSCSEPGISLVNTICKEHDDCWDFELALSREQCDEKFCNRLLETKNVCSDGVYKDLCHVVTTLGVEYYKEPGCPSFTKWFFAYRNIKIEKGCLGNEFPNRLEKDSKCNISCAVNYQGFNIEPGSRNAELVCNGKAWAYTTVSGKKMFLTEQFLNNFFYCYWQHSLKGYEISRDKFIENYSELEKEYADYRSQVSSREIGKLKEDTSMHSEKDQRKQKETKETMDELDNRKVLASEIKETHSAINKEKSGQSVIINESSEEVNQQFTAGKDRLKILKSLFFAFVVLDRL